MNITQVLEGVKKGHSYSRPALKKNSRYVVKIVSISGEPWVWSKYSIPGMFGWSRLENVDELTDEHRYAEDWIKVTRPAP